MPGWEPSPVNLDKENFRFVTDFLLANDSSRSAVASASRFGFQTLSVDCISLYVDTDNIEDLAAVAASSSTTIVIVKADLCNCTLADMETARGLIERPGLDKVQLSRRKFQLRQNRPQRCVTEVGPFQHGQSISLFAKESKGSVGVFLTPSEQSIAVTVEAKSKGPAEDASRPPPAAEDESQSAEVQPDVTRERLQPSLDREPLISQALMLEKDVPISPIKGTGRGGQITKEDVEKYKPSASAAGPNCEDIPLTSMCKTITSRLHDPSTSPVYALTAYHVLPFEEENESRVITPAGIDIRLFISKLREDELGFLISRWNQKCGDVKFGEIGTNSKGWRVDFALFSMERWLPGPKRIVF
jgi:e3 binding domain